ncbi:hypothetical protein AMECASPLE_009461 [Ameca splendens]|uniref:Uncharacterized protein n=1 Tax=Ameca splendens TaxID=208324 RepID=A0ABV0ZKS5_9TELE
MHSAGLLMALRVNEDGLLQMLQRLRSSRQGHAAGFAPAFSSVLRGGQLTALQTQTGSNLQIPWKCQPRLRKCQQSREYTQTPIDLSMHAHRQSQHWDIRQPIPVGQCFDCQ